MSAFDPNKVRKAVAELTPPNQQKFKNLLPARDVTVELRQRRASFRAIAELLTQHCLPMVCSSTFDPAKVSILEREAIAT